MSGTDTRTRLDRLKDLWWVFGALMFLAGNFTGIIGAGFTRYTTWYIEEQTRASMLKSLATNADLVSRRLEAIDATLRDQKYLNQDATTTRADFADHLHALDGRADKDRGDIADMRELLATQKERLLYLLDPKARK